MSKNYLSAWGNISVRIKSILSLINDLQLVSGDTSINEVLSENTISLFLEICNFRENFENVIPKAALEPLDNFLTREKKRQQGIFNTPTGNFSNLKVRFGLLASLESEVSYFLKDTQSNILKAVEVAFAHLQRRLMVDTHYRSQWLAADEVQPSRKKKTTEITCEKLGAEHLLLHKIWAFKADTRDGKTDIILSNPIDPSDPLYISADGLVLTEWKVLRDNNYTKIIKTAKDQAEKYRSSSLYPLELSNYCFLVIVSPKAFTIPSEELSFTEGEVKFRVINIAYNPNSPSQSKRLGENL